MHRRIDTLIVPGYGNSGPDHWQSRWEHRDATCRRVIQDDWDHPVLSAWLARLEETVDASRSPVVIAAHSLGCLLTIHLAMNLTLSEKIRGALLVAVPDPASANFPNDIVGFSSVPNKPISFPTIMVVSNDDPYAALPFSQACAVAWGSRLVQISDAGHINAASGLGDWTAGYELLEELRRR